MAYNRNNYGSYKKYKLAKEKEKYYEEIRLKFPHQDKKDAIKEIDLKDDLKARLFKYTPLPVLIDKDVYYILCEFYQKNDSERNHTYE